MRALLPPPEGRATPWSEDGARPPQGGPPCFSALCSGCGSLQDPVSIPGAGPRGQRRLSTIYSFISCYKLEFSDDKSGLQSQPATARCRRDGARPPAQTQHPERCVRSSGTVGLSPGPGGSAWLPITVTGRAQTSAERTFLEQMCTWRGAARPPSKCLARSEHLT